MKQLDNFLVFLIGASVGSVDTERDEVVELEDE